MGSPATGGVHAIKKHPFFKDIDWEKVLTRQYKPPIRPKVKNMADTRNMDKKLLKEKVLDTAPNVNETKSQSMDFIRKMHIDNFTFIGEEVV